MKEVSMMPRMLATLFALLGLLDSLYLSVERLTGGALVCPIGGGCEVVQGSEYALFLGIPVAYMGVFAYAVLLAIGLLSLQEDTLLGFPIERCLLLVASCGVLFSAYLVYLQLFVIQAICFWCMVSATLELGIFLAAAYDTWQRRDDSAEIAA
jgi:uncharacterized membrane protein